MLPTPVLKNIWAIGKSIGTQVHKPEYNVIV